MSWSRRLKESVVSPERISILMLILVGGFPSKSHSETLFNLNMAPTRIFRIYWIHSIFELSVFRLNNIIYIIYFIIWFCPVLLFLCGNNVWFRNYSMLDHWVSKQQSSFPTENDKKQSQIYNFIRLMVYNLQT